MSDGSENMRETVRLFATDAEVDEALRALRNNLVRRIKKYGYAKHISPAESLGILVEEKHEVVVAVHSNDIDDTLDEFLDVSVTGLWAYVSHMHRKKRD